MNRDFVKSLVLSSFLVAGLVNNECWGMDVRALVSELAQDPSSRNKLTELVGALVNKTDTSTGYSRANNAYKEICKIDSEIVNDVMLWHKIVSTIHAIRRDWGRSGYYGIGDIKHYVNGAYDGRFGPFSFPNNSSYEPEADSLEE